MDGGLSVPVSRSGRRVSLLETLEDLQIYKSRYQVKGEIPYEQLPKVCKMMVQYAGIEYDAALHSPSMSATDTPHWLNDEEKAKDQKFANIYDLDGRVTRDFILARSLGEILGLMPENTKDMEHCVELESQLFYLLNRMTWMINKVCYDPENPDSFDATYGQNRFSRRMRLNLPLVNELIAEGEGPLLNGDKPVYMDFLAYGCLYDLKAFVPKCFSGANQRPITYLMRHMDNLPQLKSYFEGAGKEGEYIRPPRPSILVRIGYFA